MNLQTLDTQLIANQNYIVCFKSIPNLNFKSKPSGLISNFRFQISIHVLNNYILKFEI